MKYNDIYYLADLLRGRLSISLTFNDEGFVTLIRSSLDLEEQFISGRLLNYVWRTLDDYKEEKMKWWGPVKLSNKSLTEACSTLQKEGNEGDPQHQR